MAQIALGRWFIGFLVIVGIASFGVGIWFLIQEQYLLGSIIAAPTFLSASVKIVLSIFWGGRLPSKKQ